MRWLSFFLSWLVVFSVAALDVNGELKRAQFERLATEPTPSTGRVFFDTSDEAVKYYDGLGWRTIADTTAALVNPMTSVGDVIVGGTDGEPARLAVGASGTVLKGGSTPAWGSIANADVSASAAIAYSKLADGSALSVLGRSANSSGALASIAAGTDHHVLRRSGTSLGFGLITNDNVDASAAIAGSKIQAASTGNAGVITTGAQAFAGNKNFHNEVSAGSFVSERTSGGITQLSLINNTTSSTSSSMISVDMPNTSSNNHYLIRLASGGSNRFWVTGAGSVQAGGSYVANGTGYALNNLDGRIYQNTSAGSDTGSVTMIAASSLTNGRSAYMRVWGVDNTSNGGNFLLTVGSGGVGTIHGNLYQTGHATTGSAANMFINSSNGLIARSTSSQRYKKNIADIEVATGRIYDLRPVSFDSTIEGDTQERLFGLIAEEVADIIPELAEYNGDGQPEAVKYGMLSVLLLAEIKKLRDRIAALEAAQ